MGYSDLVIEMLKHVSKRDRILGSHPDLEAFKSIYSGKTSRHVKEVIVEGKKKTVTMLTTNFSKNIAQDIAGAFLNEKITINLQDEKETELLNNILEANRFYDRINPFGEKYFGLGYGQTSVMPKHIEYNEDTNEIVANKENSVVISYNDAVTAIPITREYGNIIEAAVVIDRTDGAIVQLHLLNDDNKYDVYEARAEEKEGKYTFDYENMKTWHTNTSKPLFQAWFPNVVDNKHLDNPNGTSIYANCEDDLYVLDVIFDKLHTEFKNGGMKRFISYDLTVIDPATSEQVSVPLGDEDVYLPSAADGNSMINAVAPALRNESFQSAMTYVCNRIGASVGLGNSNYEMGAMGRPLQTATAAILKESAKGQTVFKNESLAKKNIIDLCMAIKYVYNTCIENAFTFEASDVVVKFEDNIMEDTTAKKTQDLAEVSAGVKSIAEYRSTWYGQSLEEANKFVQDNAMLVDKYITALQSGAITPTKFVELVYGTNDKATIDYITEKMSNNIGAEMTYEDEAKEVSEEE